MATISRDAQTTTGRHLRVGVPALTIRPIVAAGIFLGMGLGGFFDGIVLHQILQWHHLVSSVMPPTDLQNLQLNTLADGIFHAGTWVITAIGLGLLWRASRTPGVLWSTSAFVGSLLVGWGLFNLAEGVINHQLLALHHVRPGENQFAWDMAFLAWGLVMLLGGLAMVRRSARTAIAPMLS